MNFRLLASVSVLGLSGCAHSYFYTPEVAGEGASVRKGTLALRLPAVDPSLKLRIVCLGVTDVPKDSGIAVQDTQAGRRKMVQVRMYLLRAKPAAASPPEYFDASEQKIVLSGGSEVRLGLIHAARKLSETRIGLSGASRQIVEMYFPLPEGIRGPGEMQSFSLQWKIHFDANRAEQLVTKFDRQDARPQQGAEMFPEDPDFPYDFSPVLAPGWAYDPWPWGWWQPGPW